MRHRPEAYEEARELLRNAMKAQKAYQGEGEFYKGLQEKLQKLDEEEQMHVTLQVDLERVDSSP